MSIVPFNYHINKEMNIVYDFLFSPESKEIDHVEKAYQTKIEIDELNDSLIIKKTCTCKGFKQYRKVCKHIKKALEILRENKVEYREDDI